MAKLTYRLALREALKAASMLEAKGISAEVIDLRTLVPLALETLSTSVKKTSHAVVFTQSVEQ